MGDNNSGDTGAFLAGFVIGGLVGAAAALIMAPQTGEETRAQIAERGDYLRRTGEERLKEVRSTAESYAEQAQEQARIVLDEGRDRVTGAVERGQEEAQKIADRSKDKISSTLDGIREKSEKAAGKAKATTTDAIDSAQEAVDEAAESAQEKLDADGALSGNETGDA